MTFWILLASSFAVYILLTLVLLIFMLQERSWRQRASFATLLKLMAWPVLHIQLMFRRPSEPS